MRSEQSSGLHRYDLRVVLTLDGFIQQYPYRREAAKNLLLTRRPLLFVGAGVGADLYPVWRVLIAEMLEEARMTLTEDESTLHPPQQALLIKGRAPVVYRAVVRRHFRKFQPTMESIIMPLAQLPVGGVITTNYDDALDRAFGYHRFNSATIKDIHPVKLRDAQRYVFHIHGMIKESDQPEAELEIILADDDYKRHYHEHPTIAQFLETALNQHDIIFLGFSLTDPYVMEVVKRVSIIDAQRSRAAFPEMPVKRFALLPTEVSEEEGRRVLDLGYIETKEEEMRQYDIIPVWFEKGVNYRGLNDLVEAWASDARQARQGIAESAPGAP